MTSSGKQLANQIPERGAACRCPAAYKDPAFCSLVLIPSRPLQRLFSSADMVLEYKVGMRLALAQHSLSCDV
jgi:hypothetical protein